MRPVVPRLGIVPKDSMCIQVSSLAQHGDVVGADEVADARGLEGGQQLVCLIDCKAKA